jgi:glutathione S-transferase
MKRRYAFRAVMPNDKKPPIAHGPYLLGARFSTADLLLTMSMRWSRNMPRPALEFAQYNARLEGPNQRLKKATA